MVTIAVGDTSDDLDLVVDALQNAAVDRVTAVREKTVEAAFDGARELLEGANAQQGKADLAHTVTVHSGKTAIMNDKAILKLAASKPIPAAGYDRLELYVHGGPRETLAAHQRHDQQRHYNTNGRVGLRSALEDHSSVNLDSVHHPADEDGQSDRDPWPDLLAERRGAENPQAHLLH